MMATESDLTETTEFRDFRASGEAWLSWYRVAFVQCLTTEELNASEVKAFKRWLEVRHADTP